MFFLVIAVILTALKVMEIAPIASLSWMWIFALYALATAWWAWADSSGFTKKKAQERMDEKVKKRVERQRESLGMTPKKK